MLRKRPSGRFLLGVAKAAPKHSSAFHLAFLFLAAFSSAAAQSNSNTKHSDALSSIKALATSPDVEDRREALFRIRNLRSAEASAIARPLLVDPEPIVRATAAGSVIFLDPLEASAALIPLLGDRSPFVRKEAAYALGEVGHRGSAVAVLNAFSVERDVEVRAALAVALGKAGDASAVPALVAVLRETPDDENEFLRRSVARAIGRIAQTARAQKPTEANPHSFLPDKHKQIDSVTEAVPEAIFTEASRVLASVLRSEREVTDTRREAAFALGAIGDPQYIELLKRFSTGSDPYLAEIAREALARIVRDPAQQPARTPGK